MTKPQDSRRYAHLGSLSLAALIGVCLIVALPGEVAREWLRYDRSALADGQWWRVVTAHLVHLGPAHTILNLAGLGLLVWLFGGEIRVRAWLGAGLTAAVCIAIGLYAWSPQTAWYVGLSGVLHGWFALGAARVCEARPRFGLAMLGGLALKLGWEQLRGTMPFTVALDVGPVVVDAHLYGAAGGLLFYVMSRAQVLAGRASAPL
ncbi:MAG: rhombosortase [Gammaproteobacteria bacterium]